MKRTKEAITQQKLKNQLKSKIDDILKVESDWDVVILTLSQILNDEIEKRYLKR